MKRRQFFMITATASLGTLTGCKLPWNVEKKKDANSTNIETIGKLNLEELRERYRAALFDHQHG